MFVSGFLSSAIHIIKLLILQVFSVLRKSRPTFRPRFYIGTPRTFSGHFSGLACLPLIATIVLRRDSPVF